MKYEINSKFNLSKIFQVSIGKYRLISFNDCETLLFDRLSAIEMTDYLISGYETVSCYSITIPYHISLFKGISETILESLITSGDWSRLEKIQTFK